MSISASQPENSLWRKIWRELQPTPGRLNASLRIVLAVVITLILLLVLQMPFASIGLYQVFFVSRESPSISFRSTLALIAALVFAMTVELSVVILTDNDPIARVLSVAVVTYVAGAVLLSTTVPALGSVFGFIYCVLIDLWENHTAADTLVKTSLYLIATTALSMGVAVAVEYIFGGKDPTKELEEERRSRYQAVADFFGLYARSAPPEEIVAAGTRIAKLAVAGQTRMQTLYNTIVDRNLDTGNLPIGTRVRLTMLAQLVEVSAAFASQRVATGGSATAEVETRARCQKISDACLGLVPGAVVNWKAYQRLAPDPPVTLLDRVEGLLDNIYAMPEDTGDAAENRQLVALPGKKVPVFVPGAWRDPNTVAFALKISFCATLCYVIYHAIDYPGISTSVSTVLIAGLSTSAATNQKLVLRFVGSLIGGLLLGIGATALLFPHMDTISSLVLLIAAVTFISAWCAAGPQFGYVGLQMAFAFYLVAFEGFSAPTELAPARDRLVGILLAIVIMWFVFDQLWPVRAVTAMRRKLALILHSEARVLLVPEIDESAAERASRVDALRDGVGKAVAELRKLNEVVEYDYGADRAKEQHFGNTMLHAALAVVAIFWNQLAILQNERDQDFLTEPRLAEMRRRMAENINRMAQAVEQNSLFAAVRTDELVDMTVFKNPRFSEYARNATARHAELQNLVSTLSVNA